MLVGEIVFLQCYAGVLMFEQYPMPKGREWWQPSGWHGVLVGKSTAIATVWHCFSSVHRGGGICGGGGGGRRGIPPFPMGQTWQSHCLSSAIPLPLRISLHYVLGHLHAALSEAEGVGTDIEWFPWKSLFWGGLKVMEGECDGGG